MENTIIAPTFYDVKIAEKKLESASLYTTIDDLRKDFQNIDLEEDSNSNDVFVAFKINFELESEKNVEEAMERLLLSETIVALDFTMPPAIKHAETLFKKANRVFQK